MRRALFFIVVVLFAATSFASIPRASTLDRAREDASAFNEPLSETRVWASDVLAPWERPATSELSRALRRAYADSSTTSASGLRCFLSVDPTWDSADIGKPQSWNRYSYVLNNPINLTDPEGKQAFGPMVRSASNWRLYQEGKISRAELDKREAINVAPAATILALLAPQLLRAAFTWALGNPNQATQLVSDILSPPGSSAIIPGAVNSQFGKLDYLLGEVPNSVKSQGLGGFFKGELGFSKETAGALGEALKGQFATNFSKAVVNEKGLYEVTGQIAGANGKTAVIRSVWEKVGDNVYKFVTAVPDR